MWTKVRLTIAAFVVFSIVKSKGEPSDYSEEEEKDTEENLKELRDLIHNPVKEDSLANLGDVTKDVSELIRKYLQTNEDEEDHKAADDYLEKIHPGIVAKMNKDLEDMRKLNEQSDDDDGDIFAMPREEDQANAKSDQESVETAEEVNDQESVKTAEEANNQESAKTAEEVNDQESAKAADEANGQQSAETAEEA